MFLSKKEKVTKGKCNEALFIHNMFYPTMLAINISVLYFLCWVLFQLYINYIYIKKIIKKDQDYDSL